MNTKEMIDRWGNIVFNDILLESISFMDVPTMDLFNDFCKLAMFQNDWSHKINSAYREGDSGQHGFGKAIDPVFYFKKLGDVPVIDQFIFAYSFSKFKRIGFYPFWNAPGLHLDTKDEKLYWWQGKDKIYHYGKIASEILKWK